MFSILKSLLSSDSEYIFKYVSNLFKSLLFCKELHLDYVVYLLFGVTFIIVIPITKSSFSSDLLNALMEIISAPPNKEKNGYKVQ